MISRVFLADSIDWFDPGTWRPFWVRVQHLWKPQKHEDHEPQRHKNQVCGCGFSFKGWTNPIKWIKMASYLNMACHFNQESMGFQQKCELQIRKFPGTLSDLASHLSFTEQLQSGRFWCFFPPKKVVNRKGKLLKHGRLVKKDVNSYSQPLGGGFNNFLFSSLPGELIHFD